MGGNYVGWELSRVKLSRKKLSEGAGIGVLSGLVQSEVQAKETIIKH